MKKILILLALFAANPSLESVADVIVLTDGTTMQVYNVEPASKWVYYTEAEDDDAPVKKIAINQVFAYKIGDGKLTNVESAATEQASAPVAEVSQENGQDSPRQLDPIPAPDNEALIAAYNNRPDLVYKGKKPEPDKFTNYFLSIWGIEEGSVLSDANVEIGFEKVYAKDDRNGNVIGNRIKVTNKTNKVIYIDLASCYKIMNGNHAMPYFTNSVYSEGSSGTKGASLNLGAVASALGVGGMAGTLAGGVNVGGANTQSAGISTAEQQILSIPAYSSAFLPGLKVADGTSIVECYEPFYFSNAELSVGRGGMVKKLAAAEELTITEDKKLQRTPDMRMATRESLGIHPWIQTNFTPEDSPKHIGRVITYSTAPDFATFTSLPVKMYMRGAYGLKVSGFMQTTFNDKTYEPISDYDHLIIGPGAVKKK